MGAGLSNEMIEREFRGRSESVLVVPSSNIYYSVNSLSGGALAEDNVLQDNADSKGLKNCKTTLSLRTVGSSFSLRTSDKLSPCGNMTNGTSNEASSKSLGTDGDKSGRSDIGLSLTPRNSDKYLESASPFMTPRGVTPQKTNLTDREIRETFESNYEILKVLGKGASAEVYLVRHRETGVEYAAKIISMVNDPAKMNDVQTMTTEAKILRRVHCRHIIGMHELYETSNTMWLVMELATGGSLLNALVDLPELTEYRVSLIFRQILLGIRYLHSKGIVHRDLKMDNILYSTFNSELDVRDVGASNQSCVTDSDESDDSTESKDLAAIESSGVCIKLTDFGLSAHLPIKRVVHSRADARRIKQYRGLKEMWGTTEYFAPEVFKKAYGFQADIWALGCMLYEMLTGELAFPTREAVIPIADKILLYGGSKPERIFETKASWKRLSPSVRSLLLGMLSRNPLKRFDIDQCLAHPWIASMPDRVESSQHGDFVPSVRLTPVASSSSCFVFNVEEEAHEAVSPVKGNDLNPYTQSLERAMTLHRERFARRRRRHAKLMEDIENRGFQF